MTYRIISSPDAQEDVLKHRKSGDKSVLRKLDNILNELKQHPDTGIGKPERMKRNYSGVVYVLSAYGHYDDK